MEKLKEEWRIIEEAPNYEISNYGRVRNIKKNKLIVGSVDKDGYPRVMLMTKDENGNTKKITRYRHRLVALAFIPNPDDLPVVNHKDEDKTNPYVENLEWCSIKYNVNYGEGAKKRKEKLAQRRYENKISGKPIGRGGFTVYVYDAKTKEFIGEYPSMTAAARELNCDYRSIYKVTHGQGKIHHKMIFSFTPLS